MTTQDRIFNSYEKKIITPKSEKEIMATAQELELMFKKNYIPFLTDRRDCNNQILEIGCNKGLMTKAIVEYFKNGIVVGVDLSPNDIAFAQKYAPMVDFQCRDAFDILREEKFDIIICKAVMEHISKDRQEEFVRALYTSLNTGGMVIVAVPNMDWLLSNHERYMDFTHEIGYTRESLDDIFRLVFGDSCKVLPVRPICRSKVKSLIIFNIMRPIIIFLTNIFLTFINEGAQATWWHNREIMVIAKKEN